MFRIISNDQVLGVGDRVFQLKRGEEFEIIDTDKYNRARVRFRGEEFLMNGVMVERISNDLVHLFNPGTGMLPFPMCGNMDKMGKITRNEEMVNCEKCLTALKEKVEKPSVSKE